jgi:spore germination protein KB
MMLGILVKIDIYLYVGLKGLEYVFHVPYRHFAVPISPISMIVAVFSILISINFAKFSQEKVISANDLSPSMQLAIPFVIMIILIWKTKRNRNKEENQP